MLGTGRDADLLVSLRNPGYAIGDSPFASMPFPSVGSDGAGRALRIDWSGASFASISQIVAVTQLAYSAKCRGYSIETAHGEGGVLSYASRMNHFKLLGIDRRETFSRHSPGSEFVPMKLISDSGDPGAIATKVVDVVRTHVRSASKDMISLMDISISEIMDNVLTHAGSAESGMAGAQFYGKLGYVEFCVADSGCGIATSMSKNPSYSGRDASSLLEMAFEEGAGEFVGRTDLATDEAGAGRGLTIAARYAKALGGCLWVISHDCSASFGANGIDLLGGLHYPGTIVSMRLPMEKPIVILASDIFDGGEDVPLSWGLRDGFYTEDMENGPLW